MGAKLKNWVPHQCFLSHRCTYCLVIKLPQINLTLGSPLHNVCYITRP